MSGTVSKNRRPDELQVWPLVRLGRPHTLGGVQRTGTGVGWQSLGVPTRPAVPQVTAAFTRLARVHAVSTAADALFTTALAGSLFFSIPVGEARTKIFAYLLGAIAPFTLLSPLIGPAIDRIAGGRRWMIVASLALRSVFAFVMITHFKDLKFFLPLAFGILVMQKAYAVARSALVPTTVRNDDELVLANSKLLLLSGIMGFVAVGPGLLALHFGGPEWSLILASIVYGIGLVFALQLPRSTVAKEHVTGPERVELHAPSILLGVGGMGFLRGIVGFLSILVAFGLRTNDRPLWEFGLVGAGAVAGSLVGALIAPILRRTVREESMLIAALISVVVASGLAVFILDGVVAALVLVFAVGVAGSTGKMAFDSIVQRDAPDANRGRSFAKFETRFQIMWVIGAALAVIKMELEIGYILVFAVSTFAAFTYGVGLLAAQQHEGKTPTPATAAAVEVEAKMSAFQDAAKSRVSGTLKSARNRARPRRDDDGAEELK